MRLLAPDSSPVADAEWPRVFRVAITQWAPLRRRSLFSREERTEGTERGRRHFLDTAITDGDDEVIPDCALSRDMQGSTSWHIPILDDGGLLGAGRARVLDREPHPEAFSDRPGLYPAPRGTAPAWSGGPRCCRSADHHPPAAAVQPVQRVRERPTGEAYRTYPHGSAASQPAQRRSGVRLGTATVDGAWRSAKSREPLPKRTPGSASCGRLRGHAHECKTSVRTYSPVVLRGRWCAIGAPCHRGVRVLAA
jgi:hypothetical protein